MQYSTPDTAEMARHFADKLGIEKDLFQKQISDSRQALPSASYKLAHAPRPSGEARGAPRAQGAMASFQHSFPAPPLQPPDLYPMLEDADDTETCAVVRHSMSVCMHVCMDVCMHACI